MATAPKTGPNIKQLVLVPAIISFAITLLRLVGELNDWSPRLFSREAGGGGSFIGISWLVPIFGVYFAMRLIRDGHTPKGSLKVVGLAVAGAVAGMALIVPFISRGPTDLVAVIMTFVGAGVGVALQRIAWPELFRALLAYAFAVRIPVVLVMLVAILGEWGTHYDAAPPGGLPEMGLLAKWFFIGVVPQMSFWILFTVVIGCLSGGVTALVFRAQPRDELLQRG
jgi:hypothetical protein